LLVEISSDKLGWRQALNELGSHDFTHTFDFHRISMSNGEGEPLAFVVRDDIGRACAMWPVLKRKIDNGDLFDFTSVYGYAGPIVAAGADSRTALTAILDAMRQYGAVSLFSRMHPLFSDRLDQDFKGTALGDIVVIDVGTNQNVLSGYRGGHRREIVNARANGVAVSVESGASAIADFHAIYHQAMRNLGADDYYFFDQAYLQSMAESNDFEVICLFAIYDEKKIAASMFTITGSIMQYYLSGTISEFRHLAPSKVIIAEAHSLALKMGVAQIILGGGVGSRRDALFSFKKGFSPLFFPFHVMRHILDKDRYLSLCVAREVDHDNMEFFPAYRTVVQKDDRC
jgi:hypothetical protein